MSYLYYVVFKTNGSEGGAPIPLPNKITTREHIKELEKRIIDKYNEDGYDVRHVLITFYTLMKKTR